jgi:dephospho-CoA kinase
VVFVVIRERSTRIQAVQARDGLNVENITARINAQFDYESEENQDRLNNPNVFLLKNDVSLADLNKNVEDILQKIR